jgi:Fe-S-cluster containining protein
MNASAEIIAKHLERYGAILGEALKLDPVYTETQCGECPHMHRCCDLVVSLTPYEALGIMSWLKVHVADWLGVLERVKMRADTLQAFFVDGKFKTPHAALKAWFYRGIKCVFYDTTAKRCSIYPVRPVACRKAFGKGDCGDENASGVHAMREDDALRMVRSSRVQVESLRAIGRHDGEMCSMITMLRTNPSIGVDEKDQMLMLTNPVLLSDEDLLWGMGIRSMDNPMLETSNGSSRNADGR